MSGPTGDLGGDASRPADLLINGRLIGRVEVVAVDGNLDLRIAEVVMPGADRRRVAAVAVNATLPDGSVFTEQCGLRIADDDGPIGQVNLIGSCELAERLTEVGPDVHVHRYLLSTPWQAQPGRRRRSRSGRGR